MKEDTDEARTTEAAHAVREACKRAAEEAFERAGLDGLCREGAIEAALDAIQAVNVAEIVRKGRRKEE